MKLNNPFSQDTKLLYLYCYACFDCGRSDRGLEIHHIVGRSSKSPLNAFPICKHCHNKCNHNDKEEGKYLKIALKFLLRESYKLTEEDIEFYNKHYGKYNK